MLLRFFLFSSFLTVLSVFSAPKFINTESTLIGEQQEGRISISSGSTAADGEFATGLKKFSSMGLLGVIGLHTGKCLEEESDR